MSDHLKQLLAKLEGESLESLVQEMLDDYYDQLYSG